MKKINNKFIAKLTSFAQAHYNKVIFLGVVTILGYSAYFCVNLLYSPQDQTHYDDKLSEVVRNQVRFNQETLDSLDALIGSKTPVVPENAGRQDPFSPVD